MPGPGWSAAVCGLRCQSKVPFLSLASGRWLLRRVFCAESLGESSGPDSSSRPGGTPGCDAVLLLPRGDTVRRSGDLDVEVSVLGACLLMRGQVILKQTRPLSPGNWQVWGNGP